MERIKLNLGCGFDKLPGYLNVDKEAACEPDRVVDLEAAWPFETNSVQEIRASHVLEHLGQTTSVFLGIMKEMYRVCEDGAKIYIQVPHHDHWTFHADPTHVRKIVPEGLKLLIKSSIANTSRISTQIRRSAFTATSISCWNKPFLLSTSHGHHA